jgi:hypothetical protein
MAIEKVIDIKIESNADERVGSLRSQLREAQADVAALSEKFGVTSKEAIEAAKRAGQLKDQIADARALTDAFNPDAKFKALSSSLAGVAGGFAALQGAQSLFGEQSKEVEQTLLKVQAAMALSQGLQTIGESIDSFKQLGAVAKSYTIVQRIVTAGQWLWNAALAANPIGALVVVIAALIAAGVALVNYFKGASAAAAQNTAAVKENEKAIKNQSKTLDENSKELDRKQKHELAMAKASGASASAIRALELKLIDEKIAYEKSAKAVAMNTYEKNKNYLMSLKASGADEDLIKKQTEVVNESVKQVNKQSENLKKAYDERKDIQLRHQVEVRQAQTDHNKKVADKNKEASDKAKEDAIAEAKRLKEQKAKEIISDAEAFRNKLEAVQKVERDAKKANDDALLSNKEKAIKAENEDYNLKIKNAQEFGEKTEEVTRQHLNKLKKIEDDDRLKKDEEKKAELEKTINDNNATFEARLEAVDAEQALLQKQFDDKLISEEQFTEKTKQLAKSRITIGDLETKAKIEQAQRGAALLSNISDLIGKDTAAGKVAAVAATTINTYAAAQTAFFNAQKNPISILGPAYPYISAGLAIAGGLKNVQAILSVPTPGGGGGGGSAPSGGGSAMTAPSFNSVGSSSTNQLAQSIGTQSQTPVRSYVVASDVSTAQALDRNIIRNATIGG